MFWHHLLRCMYIKIFKNKKVCRLVKIVRPEIVIPGLSDFEKNKGENCANKKTHILLKIYFFYFFCHKKVRDHGKMSAL